MVIMGGKIIMTALCIVESKCNYNALLGRNRIDTSLCVPLLPHAITARYYEDKVGLI